MTSKRVDSDSSTSSAGVLSWRPRDGPHFNSIHSITEPGSLGHSHGSLTSFHPLISYIATPLNWCYLHWVFRWLARSAVSVCLWLSLGLRLFNLPNWTCSVKPHMPKSFVLPFLLVFHRPTSHLFHLGRISKSLPSNGAQLSPSLAVLMMMFHHF